MQENKMYKSPIYDIKYAFNACLFQSNILKYDYYSDFSENDLLSIVKHAAKMCETVFAPLNRPGDEEGCRLAEGSVTTPSGFRAAFERYRADGWSGLVADPVYGGQGLPLVMQTILDEMMASANLSLTSYPGLSLGAYHALAHHGTAAQKARYLPPLVAGRWTGTMCLTEPQCGSDLALLTTRATPLEGGRFALQGTKIFISAGDHDLSDNILHLVLARLPDAPPGIRGISLFLVPKFAMDAEGKIGDRNGVTTVAIEHKMGLRASATCQLSFEGAIGEMIGAPHQGLKVMFSMMNVERLAVAMQGVGLAEISRQRAARYASERLQGRSATSGSKAVPIAEHPDVKRMLMTQRAYVEGMRALTIAIGLKLDERLHDPDPASRKAADDFVQFMTPVAKAFCTDLGVECTRLGIQIWGGHGYIRENGMEQYLRDAVIAPIYEGTNGIQAADLVGRKVREDDGTRLEAVFGPIRDFLIETSGQGAALAALATAFAGLERATAAIRVMPEEQALALATTYLKFFGLVVTGYYWGRMLCLSQGREEPFHRQKVVTATFYLTFLLGEWHMLAAQIEAGGASILMAEAEMLAM